MNATKMGKDVYLLKRLDEFKQHLVGKKITQIRNLSDKEMEIMGWYKNPLVIVLNDYTQIILQSDDEGNDGGAAFLFNDVQDLQTTIYTI